MATLVPVDAFRAWAGANVPASVPDALIQDCLDEAEAGIIAETGVAIATIKADPSARSIAVGEEKRRASRLLARRNSPESILGAGSDGIVVSIPVRDADSQRAIWQMRSILRVPEGVA